MHLNFAKSVSISIKTSYFRGASVPPWRASGAAAAGRVSGDEEIYCAQLKENRQVRTVRGESVIRRGIIA